MKFEYLEISDLKTFPIKTFRQLDTSPTQGWGKVGARSWTRLGQGRARLGQGLDKKQGSGKVWAGKVWARFGQQIVIMGLISDRGRR